MKSSRAMKLVGLITGAVLLNIVALSPGLLGIEIGGNSALETASGITLLFSSLLVLLYGSYALLLKAPVMIPVKDIQSHVDYITALNHYRNVKVLNKDILFALDQLERMAKKKITLLNILSQRFDEAELSFKKFLTVIHEVENLFYLNIKGILHKLSIFDASELSIIASPQTPAPLSNKWLQQKIELYQEYLASVKGYLGANEEILLKLDQLLLETSRLGSTDYNDIEEMPCMKEIDTLIKQTKFYQQ
jgi:hypothetical protein